MLVVPSDPPPTTAARYAPWVDLSFSRLPSVTSSGRSVLFISDRGGIPHPWSVPLDGGEPKRVFGGEERIEPVLASPDSEEAIFGVDAGGDEHWQLRWLLLKAGAEPVALTDDPKVIHNPGAWRGNGHFLYTSNRRDPRFFDAYEVDVRHPGQDRCLLQKDGWVSVRAARGDRALFTHNRTNLDADLFLLQGDTMHHLNPHEGELSVQGAALGKDAVYVGSNPGREFAALIRYKPGRSSHEFLREYPGDVELVEANPQGTQLALTVNRQGWSELHVYDLSTGEDRPLTSGPPGVVEGISWTPDGSKFVYDLSSMAEGKELYVRNVETGKEKRLTRAPVPLPARIPDPKLSQVRTEDGLQVPCWEYLPPHGAPLGTVLWLHGGPEAQARPIYQPTIGFLAAEGWRVVVPNVRGSAGYGRTYVHLDDVRKRMDSVRDLRDLARSLEKAGKGTWGKFGVIGGSYGGFLVLSALCTYPDAWGAGVDIVGISNFVTFLERTGPWRRKVREAEYGSLEADGEFLARISPLHHAEKIQAPLLVIHGSNDPRVPLHEAEQIVQNLQGRHRPVELLTYANEGHGLVRRENRIEAYARAADFFRAHLLSKPTPSRSAAEQAAEEARIYGGE